MATTESSGNRDARLHAWLDGELPPEERPEIEQWLSEHPADAAQVRLWAADGAAIRQQLDPVLDEPVPMRLEQIVWTRSPVAMSMRWQRLAAASAVFAVGAVIGVAFVWSFQPRPPTFVEAPAAFAWVQRAAVAHRVYTPESRHPVEVNVYDKGAPDHVAQEAHLSRWLTNRLDVPVKLFDLRAQGFELVGGRLLPDAAGPSAQLMYQHTGGQRVTVYLRKPDSVTPVPTPPAFAYERWGELGMFYWVEGQAGYALVGDLPRERLLALAEAIYKQGAEPPKVPPS
ncbi:anti-sigma factor [soil metagenome]